MKACVNSERKNLSNNKNIFCLSQSWSPHFSAPMFAPQLRLRFSIYQRSNRVKTYRLPLFGNRKVRWTRRPQLSWRPALANCSWWTFSGRWSQLSKLWFSLFLLRRFLESWKSFRCAGREPGWCGDHLHSNRWLNGRYVARERWRSVLC